jgi:hypothetical protein
MAGWKCASRCARLSEAKTHPQPAESIGFDGIELEPVEIEASDNECAILNSLGNRLLCYSDVWRLPQFDVYLFSARSIRKRPTRQSLSLI